MTHKSIVAPQRVQKRKVQVRALDEKVLQVACLSQNHEDLGDDKEN